MRLDGLLYAVILKRVESNRHDVFTRRAATSKPYKLRTAAGVWAAERFGTPRPLVRPLEQPEPWTTSHLAQPRSRTRASRTKSS